MSTAFLLQKSEFLQFCQQFHRLFLREAEVFLNLVDLINDKDPVVFIEPGILPG